MIHACDFDEAAFVGRSISEETKKHCAENAIPIWGRGGRRINPPTHYHSGYRIKLNIPHINQPWRHVHVTLRGQYMVKINGRWKKLAAGTEVAMMWLAHAKASLSKETT